MSEFEGFELLNWWLAKLKKKNIGTFSGNKLDILPNTGGGWMENIAKCLIENCESKGIQGAHIRHLELISAKTGMNVERLVSSLFDFWNDQGERQNVIGNAIDFQLVFESRLF